ncbi:hypothetical protein D3C76_1286480 [compost metagenome]
MASISYLLFKITMFVLGLLCNGLHCELGNSIDVQLGSVRIVVQTAAADQHGKHKVDAVVFALDDRLEWNIQSFRESSFGRMPIFFWQACIMLRRHFVDEICAGI